MTKRLPQFLYHYTKLPAVASIVESSELRLTDTRYMADQREWDYPVLLAAEMLQGAAKTPAFFHRRDWLIQLSNELVRLLVRQPGFSFHAGYRTFATCFCTDGDLLSQWREYGAGSGYAIQFDRVELRKAAKAVGGKLVRCEYSASRQRRLLGNALDPTVRQIVEEKAASPWAAVGPVVDQLLTAISQIKHPMFQVEHEWRIVRPAVDERPDDVDTTGALPRPYVRCKFDPSAVRAIIVGPQPGAARGVQALRDWSIGQGREIEIRSSEDSYLYRADKSLRDDVSSSPWAF